MSQTKYFLQKQKIKFVQQTKDKLSQNTRHQSQRPKQETCISKKYCLNKPKIIKEFQNSKLFRTTLNPQFLKSYTPRYTYNQKTKSFEKQNTAFVQPQFDVNYTSIENLHRQNSAQISKLILLKKKSPKINFQKTHSSLSPQEPTQNSFDHNQTARNIGKDRKAIGNMKQSRQKSVLRKTSQKYLQSTNQNFFSFKDPNKTIKEYISSNPSNYNPLKLDQFEKKISRIKKFNVPKLRKGTKKAENQLSQYISNSKINSFRTLEQANAKNQEDVVSKKQELFKRLQQQIKRLYDIIKQLKNLGYAEQKVNEWVWSYCENNKKFMQTILFKAQGYKASLAEHKIIYKLEDIEVAKVNSKKFKRIINNQQIPLHPEDISDMSIHLQQILISKQYFELKRIQTQIQDTSYSIQNDYFDMQDEKGKDIIKLIDSFDQKKKIKPMEYYETLNFYEDAKRLETHFGKIKGLTTANKTKCQNLTEVQIQILRKNK